MKYSVVGLPHYTVWHMYEPSVDDLRHMEEMEQERKAREKEEKERQDRLNKIKDEFNEPNSQWEKDKMGLEDMLKAKSSAGSLGDEKGPIAPTKEPAEREAGKASDAATKTQAVTERKATYR